MAEARHVKLHAAHLVSLGRALHAITQTDDTEAALAVSAAVLKQAKVIDGILRKGVRPTKDELRSVG